MGKADSNPSPIPGWPASASRRRGRRVSQFACPVGLVLVGVFGEPGDQVVVPGVDLVALLRRVGVRVESVVATFDPPEVRAVAAAVPPVAQHGPVASRSQPVRCPAFAMSAATRSVGWRQRALPSRSTSGGAVAAVASSNPARSKRRAACRPRGLRHPFSITGSGPLFDPVCGDAAYQFVHDDPPVRTATGSLYDGPGSLQGRRTTSRVHPARAATRPPGQRRHRRTGGRHGTRRSPAKCR